MIGGIVQGIGQVAGSLINAGQEAKNRKMQIEENQKDRDWQEKMWNKSNEYNDPSQQLQRYKEAGLNPNLVFGQGGSSIASQFGAPSSHNIGTSPQYGDALKGLGNVFTAIEELKNLKKTGDNIDADTDMKRADAEETRSRIPGNQANTEGVLIDNMFKLDTYEARKAGIDAENRLKNITADWTEDKRKETQQNVENLRVQNDVLHQTVENMKTHNRLEEAQIDKVRADISNNFRIVNAQVSLMSAQERNECAQAVAAYARADESRASAGLMRAQTRTEDTMRAVKWQQANKYLANTIKEGKMLDLDTMMKECDLDWQETNQWLNAIDTGCRSFANVCGGIGSVMHGGAAIQSTPAAVSRSNTNYNNSHPIGFRK